MKTRKHVQMRHVYKLQLDFSSRERLTY